MIFDGAFLQIICSVPRPVTVLIFRAVHPFTQLCLLTSCLCMTYLIVRQSDPGQTDWSGTILRCAWAHRTVIRDILKIGQKREQTKQCGVSECMSRESERASDELLTAKSLSIGAVIRWRLERDRIVICIVDDLTFIAFFFFSFSFSFPFFSFSLLYIFFLFSFSTSFFFFFRHVGEIWVLAT